MFVSVPAPGGPVFEIKEGHGAVLPEAVLLQLERHGRTVIQGYLYLRHIEPQVPRFDG